MSEKQLTHKQHFVPRMYLKRWVYDGGEMVYVISKKKENQEVYSVSYDNELFYENDCYDINLPNGDLYTNNEVEKLLGKYEDRHNKLLDRMIACCENGSNVIDKGTNRLSDFIEFLTLMLLRNPQNNIPLEFDGIKTSTVGLSELFSNMFWDDWKISGLEIAVNCMDKKSVENLLNEYKTKLKPKVFFLKSTDDYGFITSDNPVLCAEKWSYIALSPQYACFLLFDTRMQIKYIENKVFTLSSDEVLSFNRLFWKQQDAATIVGNCCRDVECAI